MFFTGKMLLLTGNQPAAYLTSVAFASATLFL